MQQTSAALNHTSAQPPPPQKTTGKYTTLAQSQIAQEFCQVYGFAPSQISFEGEQTDPIFDFDALSLLALELTNHHDITVDFGDLNPVTGLATARCYVELADGRVRRVFGSCIVGDFMPDGSTISTLQQALTVARARSLRIGLRAVGFDPVRAHYEREKNGVVEDSPVSSEEQQRSNDLKQIHILAKEVGLIQEDNKTKYVRTLESFFNVTSSADLSPLQRAQFIATLKALKNARSASA